MTLRDAGFFVLAYFAALAVLAIMAIASGQHPLGDVDHLHALICAAMATIIRVVREVRP